MTALMEHRRAVRLHVDNGVALLRCEGFASIACTLGDLSESGCHCTLAPQSIDSAVFEQWRKLLAKGVPLEAEISKPPHVLRLRLNAAVAHVEPHDDHGLDLGLVFTDRDTPHNECLRHALMSIAADKIKHAPRSALQNEKTATMQKAIREAADRVPAPAPSTDVVQRKHDSVSGKSFGEVLVLLRLLTPEQVEAAEKMSQRQRVPFTRHLIQQHLIGPADLCRALSLHSGMPVSNLKGLDIPKALTRLFSYLTMLRFEFVPFTESREILCIAAAAPLAEATRAELMRICGKELLVFLAPLDQIRSQLFRLRPRAVFQERAHARSHLEVPVTLQYCDLHGVNLDEAIYDGTTVDLSEGGFQIDVPEPAGLAAENLLERKARIRLDLSCAPHEIHAVCSIRHIELSPSLQEHQKRWHLGLQIAEISPADLENLRNHCTNLAELHLHERRGSFEMSR